jgi:hypothetical protein
VKIEAVTVCVGYGDFLRETAPWVRPHLDRWAVVTDPADAETREACRRLGLHCVLSEEHRREMPFNKGRLIRRGIDQLACDGWVLHLDADMALPSMTRWLLEAAHLDPACIYGCDRLMVRGWGRWQELLKSGWLHQAHDYHCRVNIPAGFDLGHRWADLLHGYCPLGAFQLWHGSADLWQGIHAKPYPAHHGDAARGDIQHGLQWDRRKRVLLPELVAAHLESEPAPTGANWQGRKTKRFGAAPPAEARTTHSPS